MRRTLSEKLPCGCIKGKRICPKADALWRSVQEAYDAAAANTDDARSRALWNRYTAAICRYDAHFDYRCRTEVMAGWGIGDCFRNRSVNASAFDYRFLRSQ